MRSWPRCSNANGSIPFKRRLGASDINRVSVFQKVSVERFRGWNLLGIQFVSTAFQVMLFNSYVFLFAFLPIVFSGYWLLVNTMSGQWARLWALIASLFFFAWWNPPDLL